jgi:DNA topoisomerase-1
MDLKLKYVSDQTRGISRRKRGKGFEYFDQDGNKIMHPKMIDRIQDLKIPPNWQEVWICTMDKGHIQATGLDQKGRKQYLYHQSWQEHRNQSKYKKLLEFGRALPRIRETASSHVRKRDWPREKVLALIVLIMDEVHIRIGNRKYQKNNETFGLTTLRRKHLHPDRNSIELDYKAKSGKYRKVSIQNRKLSKLIQQCSELPGYEVFRYRENGSTIPVDSSDVNEYLHEIGDESFSSKDFRTWGGTVMALEKLPEALRIQEENPRRKLTTTLIKLVAAELGNTQSICREYYIHPAILKLVENEQFDKLQVDQEAGDQDGLHPSEVKILKILKDYYRNDN